MTLYPAIDLKDGKAVRLTKGLMDSAKIYSGEPWTLVKKFEKNDPTYILINDFAKQVYAKNITDSIGSSINVHEQCISLQVPKIEYTTQSLSTCPMIANAIDTVFIAKKMGMERSDALSLINKEYADYSTDYKGGFKKLVKNTFESENSGGLNYYRQCMIENVL